MAYFSTYYPEIESTRMELESRIRSLEDRLYMRRQLTADIEREDLQFNISNIYKLLKQTIESQSRLQTQIRALKEEVGYETRYNTRLNALEDARRTAEERAILLEKQLQDLGGASMLGYSSLGRDPYESAVKYSSSNQQLRQQLEREYRESILRSREASLAATNYGAGLRNADQKSLDTTTFPLKNEQLQNTNFRESSQTGFAGASKASYNREGEKSLTDYTPFKNLDYSKQNISAQMLRPEQQPERRRSSDSDRSERLVQKYIQGDRAREYEEMLRKYREKEQERSREEANAGAKDQGGSSKKQVGKIGRKSRRTSPESDRKNLSQTMKPRDYSDYSREDRNENYDNHVINHSDLKKIDLHEDALHGSRRSGHPPGNNPVDRSLERYRNYEPASHHHSRISLNASESKQTVDASRRRQKKNPEVQTKARDCAIKRIQNRMKQIWAVYEDSHFRNQKHEHDHLHNTYTLQSKMRKQLKHKIEFQPQIQRKFGFRVEA